ncbi:MAG TPA: nitroreductase family deazaflavin-dependent oxidoreductase [Acidimicrobiia bacterium]|nr:nitroreductase family deazaflavin-dependent oxidoreductase [Acidimicrobiia bacterium]
MKPKNAVRLDRTVGRAVYRLHLWMYRKTDGRIGRDTAQGPVILLTYTGRKSGKEYTTPLLSVPDGDGWIVVASNGGRPNHPAWYLNVKDLPDVEVQDGRRKVKAKAVVADAERRAELWPHLFEAYEGWAHYQTLTDREIPVVELRPVS